MNSDDFVPFDSNKNLLDGDNKNRVPSSSSFALPALITDVRAPWMLYCQSDTEGDSSSTSLVRLHNEILTFCEYIAPTKVSLSSLLSPQLLIFTDFYVNFRYQVSSLFSFPSIPYIYIQVYMCMHMSPLFPFYPCTSPFLFLQRV
jgi:hypothetical protein